MIRVLVAEDSATSRALLVAILESDPGIEVVGQALDGMDAIEKAARLRPDLITMDLHMPRMDGIEAIRRIMAESPVPIVVVTASLNARDVELSLNATLAGALTIVDKPDSPASPRFEERRERLISMVKALAEVKVVRRWSGRSEPAARASLVTPRGTARIVALAASTGGPAALHQILRELPREFTAPVLIVQHIARGFVDGLAHWLGSAGPIRVKVAEDGEIARPGVAYLAPDDHHLGVRGRDRIQLADGPAIGGFRPSASHLFASVAHAHGAATVGVILTGMGADGVQGLGAVRSAGGHVLAQDQASSVVYGMPAEAVRAGVVSEVISLESLPRRLAELVSGDGRGAPHTDR